MAHHNPNVPDSLSPVAKLEAVPAVAEVKVQVERMIGNIIECECGWPMVMTNDGLYCCHINCEWKNVMFARPTITLTRVVSREEAAAE